MKLKYIAVIIIILFMLMTPLETTAQHIYYFPIIFKGSPQLINTKIIMTKQDRINTGLLYWPDGILYFEPPNIFYAAGNGHSVRSTGQLDRPFSSWSYIGMHTINTFNYFGGGPIYTAPDGTMVMFYHGEYYYKSYKEFRSIVGTAISYDNGNNFYDTGIAIDSNYDGPADVGGGPFLVVGDYFYLYTIDRWAENDYYQFLCVSRARIADVLAGHGEWLKYYNGDFTEPGLRGKCSSLITTQNGWMDTKQIGNKYYLVTTDGYNLRLFDSVDGINWVHRKLLKSSTRELSYPTMIYDNGTLYLYYTDSVLGGLNRWQDANYMRGEIINY